MGRQNPLRTVFQQTSILLLVLLLILGPRPLAGYLDLRAAQRAVAADQNAEAAPYFVSAASRIPWRGDLWGRAGQSAWLAGEPQLALRWFAEGESRDALSMADWLTYGDVFLALGDPGSARWAWQECIARYGAPSGANWRLALLHRQAGEFQQAIDLLLDMLEDQAPDGAEVYYELGLLLAAVDPQRALPHLVRAVELDPELDPMVRDLRTSLNTALLSNDRAYQYLVAGRALAVQGHWDLAEFAFQNALAEKYDYGEAWAWLSEAQQQLGGDGSLAMQRALAFDPESALVQALSGLALQRRGEAGAALAAYQEAARLEPDVAGWQIALGGAWEQSGDLIEARAHYERAVELAPGEPAAWRALAAFSLGYQIELVDLGLVSVRRLLVLAPGDWSAYDLAGQILLETGDPVGAEVMLKRAMELDPTQAAVSLHLALVYLQGPLPSNAYAYLVNARTFDPEGAIGWQANRLLEQYFP